MPREILIIDDDLSMRAFASRVLTDRGFRVREAGDGLAGLEAVKERTPDLVLVDFVMPRMNGYHFLRALEAQSLILEVPVILMSTLTDKVGDRLLDSTRAVECLKKPYDEAGLLDVVDRHLAEDAIAKTATTSLHPGLEVEDDWLLVASVREKLHGQVADALAPHVADLVGARSNAEVLATIAAVLDELFDEHTVEELVGMVRQHDLPKRKG